MLTEIELRRIDSFAQEALSELACKELLKIDTNLERHIGMVVFTLYSSLFGEECSRPIEIRYPKNWIEAVKERWLPCRLRKMFPIKYTYHKIEHMVGYPDFSKQYIPSLGRKLNFLFEHIHEEEYTSTIEEKLVR